MFSDMLCNSYLVFAFRDTAVNCKKKNTLKPENKGINKEA